MKPCFLIFSCIFFFVTVSFYNSDAQEFPNHQDRAVNDFAGVIPNEEKAQIEAICNELWQKTNTAVVVVTIPTIGDNYIEDYANRLYEKWGIGRKGEDKGVLLINAINDRTIRIETGYGVEGILPDGLTGAILDKYVIPELGNENYGAAYLTGVRAIAGIIAKDAGVQITGEIAYDPGLYQDSGGEIGTWLPLIIILLIILTRGRIIPWLFSGSISRGGSFQRRGSRGSGFGSRGFSGGFGGGFSGGGGASRRY